MKRTHFIWIGVALGALLITAALLVTRSNPETEASLTPSTSNAPNLLPGTDAPGVTGASQQGKIVRLAWFYKPPDSAETALVLKKTDLFVLTHKDETERDQYKQQGVSGPFSMYLLALVINDPGDCQDEPNGNQVAYKAGDFCQISEQHPDWFLLDGNGERIRSSKNSYYMDPGNEGYRAFWLQRARDLQETYGWDNIFLDNVEASRAKMVEDHDIPAKYPDDASYQKAVEGFLAYIRQNYFQPQNKKMYANIVSLDKDRVFEAYLEYLDGAMMESFATDWSDGYRSRDEWEQQMDLAQKALDQGKTLILVSQGEQDDLKLQNFAFASYLLLANGNAYFRYTHSDSYRELWLYQNYNLDPGQPLGPRYKSNGGWRRDFSNGYVFVNPKSHKAEIVIQP